MNQDKIRIFAASLRRAMYLLKMLSYEVEFMKDISPNNKLTRLLVVSNHNLTSQLLNVRSLLDENAKRYVDNDLSKDQLISLANIIHLLADIDNVEEFEDEIKRIVEEAMEKHKSPQPHE